MYRNPSLVGLGAFGVDCTATPNDPNCYNGVDCSPGSNASMIMGGPCDKSYVYQQNQQITSQALDKYMSSPWFTVYKILSIVGATTGAYHGYKRNDSVGWAIGWFLLGGAFPFITIPVSLAEGYAKPHSKRVIVDK